MDLLNRPSAVISRLKPVVSTIAAANPTISAASERRASRAERRTTAVQIPASGPNSGPTAIAPTIRIALSSTTPHAAIIVATARKARYVTERVDSSCVASASWSHSTASAPSPGASSSAWSARRDSDSSMSSTAIEPLLSMPSAHRSAMSPSPAFARDVAQDEIARRVTGGAGDDDQVGGADGAFHRTYDLFGQLGRDDQAQMQHRWLSDARSELAE